MNESILIESINDKIKALKKELLYWKNQHKNDVNTRMIILNLNDEIIDNKNRVSQIQKIIERSLFKGE